MEASPEVGKRRRNCNKNANQKKKEVPVAHLDNIVRRKSGHKQPKTNMARKEWTVNHNKFDEINKSRREIAGICERERRRLVEKRLNIDLTLIKCFN